MVTGFRELLFCAGLILIAAGVAGAQTRATSADLTGIVYDQSKAVLPGVTVTITNVETGLTRSVATEADGRFAAPALPPGTYTVRAELQGFTPQILQGIQLALGAAVDVTVTLAIAATVEEITVTAEAPVVDTQKTAVSSVVSIDSASHAGPSEASQSAPSAVPSSAPESSPAVPSASSAASPPSPCDDS